MSAVHVIHWSTHRFTGRTVPAGSNEASVVRHIIAGHVDGKIDRIDCYDTDEDWARDVTEDVAIAVANQLGRDDVREISQEVLDFIEAHAGTAYARGLRVADRSFAAA